MVVGEPPSIHVTIVIIVSQSPSRRGTIELRREPVNKGLTAIVGEMIKHPLERVHHMADPLGGAGGNLGEPDAVLGAKFGGALSRDFVWAEGRVFEGIRLASDKDGNKGRLGETGVESRCTETLVAGK